MAQDSAAEPAYIARQLRYSCQYPYVQYADNYLTYTQPAAMSRFYDALKAANDKQAKIVHIGDDHIQTGVFTGAARERFQDIFGAGGRGLLFPFACANTYSENDFFSYKLGENAWTFALNTQPNPALPLGLTGATLKTEDPKAGFKIEFNKFYRDRNYRKLKIFCQTSEQSFDLAIRLDGEEGVIFVSCAKSDKPYVETLLPRSPKTIEIQVVKKNESQKFFECYGLSLEKNVAEGGLLYHSAGIDGANLLGIVKAEKLEEQLRSLNPDLVVLDGYLNEFADNSFAEGEFRLRLLRAIKTLQRAVPTASILVVSAQDAYYHRSVNVTACRVAAQVAREVALEQGCAFYDFYNIAGGQGSLLKWQANDLAHEDRVHLTPKGYAFKAELFCAALLGSYYQFLNGSAAPPYAQKPNPYFARTAPEPKIEPRPEPKPEAKAETKTEPKPETKPAEPPKPQTIRHTVKKGEFLGGIAAKYGVTVSQLQKWNGLKTTNIKIGQVLTIQKSAETAAKTEAGTKSETAAKTETKPAEKAPNTAAQTHTVKSGESLWLIARKYNLSVEKLKKLNGLKTDAVKPGQKLKVK